MRVADPFTKDHIVKFTGGSVSFVELTRDPALRNYYKLTTTEHMKFDAASDSFKVSKVTAVLYLKKDENTQKLEEFSAKNMDLLKSKIIKRIETHYLGR